MKLASGRRTRGIHRRARTMSPRFGGSTKQMSTRPYGPGGSRRRAIMISLRFGVMEESRKPIQGNLT